MKKIGTRKEVFERNAYRTYQGLTREDLCYNKRDNKFELLPSINKEDLKPGTKEEVFNGLKKYTKGGLIKDEIIKTDDGKYISKRILKSNTDRCTNQLRKFRRVFNRKKNKSLISPCIIKPSDEPVEKIEKPIVKKQIKEYGTMNEVFNGLAKRTRDGYIKEEIEFNEKTNKYYRNPSAEILDIKREDKIGNYDDVYNGLRKVTPLGLRKQDLIKCENGVVLPIKKYKEEIKRNLNFGKIRWNENLPTVNDNLNLKYRGTMEEVLDEIAYKTKPGGYKQHEVQEHGSNPNRIIIRPGVRKARSRGNRKEVYYGLKDVTGGGLRKEDLIKCDDGKIISKRKRLSMLGNKISKKKKTN